MFSIYLFIHILFIYMFKYFKSYISMFLLIYLRFSGMWMMAVSSSRVQKLNLRMIWTVWVLWRGPGTDYLEQVLRNQRTPQHTPESLQSTPTPPYPRTPVYRRQRIRELELNPHDPLGKLNQLKEKIVPSILIPFFSLLPHFFSSLIVFLLLEQSQSMSSGWVFKNLFKFALKIMKSKVPYSCLIFSVAKP